MTLKFSTKYFQTNCNCNPTKRVYVGGQRLCPEKVMVEQPRGNFYSTDISIGDWCSISCWVLPKTW